MTVATFWTELVSGSRQFFHGEQHMPFILQPFARTRKDGPEVAQINQRIGSKDQIVAVSVLTQIGFDIGKRERVVNPAGASILDHTWREVHAIEAFCEGLECIARQTGAAAEVQNVERAARAYDQIGELTQDEMSAVRK